MSLATVQVTKLKTEQCQGLVGLDVCRATCRATATFNYLRVQSSYNSAIQFLDIYQETPTQLHEDTHRKLPTASTVCGDQELEATWVSVAGEDGTK